MLGDIAIMVFALIAIFTGKKWAIITATIWFIVNIIIGIAIGLLMSNLMEPDVASDVAESATEFFDDVELASIFLMSFELLFIIIGWIRVIFTKKKQIIINNTPFVPKEEITYESLERVDNSSYQIGTIVSHQAFGNGKIIGKEWSGDNLILTVLFSNGQEKKLLAKFANLTIIK